MTHRQYLRRIDAQLKQLRELMLERNTLPIIMIVADREVGPGCPFQVIKLDGFSEEEACDIMRHCADGHRWEDE